MRRLWAFATFQGRLNRVLFAPPALVAFFMQHAIVFELIRSAARSVDLGPYFWIAPITAAHIAGGAAPLDQMMAMMGLVLAAWMLAAIGFARATDAGVSGWAGALAVVPGIQVLVLLALAVLPPREMPVDAETVPARTQSGQLAAAVGGVLAGAALCVAAVAVSTLIFGVYGYGLFFASPFVVGITTGYAANRRRALSDWQTIVVVSAALLLGGLLLIAVLLEGAICIVMASPLALFLGAIGGFLGRALALRGREPPEATVFAAAFLPVLFAIEHAALAPAYFTTDESVVVSAPADAVWRAVVAMGPIPERPSLPFRLGLAYPLDGKIEGEGVGAIRKGYFSTGVAYERITAWRPGRELAFDVLSDPPMLRELSPYSGLQTPHLLGYYHTGAAAFLITPLTDGRARLTLRTSHVLKLDPAPYWLPFAKWAVRENKLRVLAHFKRVAENAASPVPR